MSKQFKLLLAVIVLLTLAVVGCQQRAEDEIRVRGYTNFDSIQIDVPTIQLTATPGLLIENDSAGAVSFEVRNASSTPVFSVANTGASLVLGNQIITGATAATTATPVMLLNNAADVNDLFIVEKDSTPVFTINNAGTYTSGAAGTHTGGETFNNWAVVTGATAQTTATPVVRIGNAADANDLFIVEKDSTPVFTINNSGTYTSLGAGTHTGGETFNSWAIVTGATAQTTATPVVRIDNAADVNDLFVIEKDSTAVLKVGNAGAVDVTGDISDSGGAVTFADNVAITGQAAGTEHFVITGASSQTAASLVVEDSSNTNVFTVIEAPAAASTGDLVDITDTLAIMDGTDAVIGIDLNITSADHTGSGNVLTGIDIGNITGDAETTDTGIIIGTGWDTDVDGTTNLILGVDNTAVVTIMDPQAAGTGGNLVQVDGTFGIMDGSDTSTGIDVNLTGADHTSTVNAVRGIDLGLTTADADAVESAVYIGDNWDADVNATTDMVLAVDGTTVVTIMDPPAVNTDGDLIDITATWLGMDGTDTHIGIDMNLTNASGSSTNILRGIDLALASAQGTVTESGLYLGAGWDADINAVTDLVIAVDDNTVVTVVDPAAAGTGSSLVTVAGTFGIMDNSDDSIGIDVNLTGADHTGSANTVRGIDLALTTADAQATESAVYIGDNWDADVNATTDMVLAVDDTTVVTIMDPQAAGSGGDLVDVTGTFNIMDGSDSSVGIDVNLTGADHTSTVNAVRGIELGLTTPDADATESAVYIEDNWDLDVNATTNLVLGVDGTTVVTVMDPAAAGSGGYLLDLTGTYGIMDGDDTSVGFDINLTGANATGTTNYILGMDIDLTTADPQVAEKAIDVSDTDFDYAIDAGAVPIFCTAQTIFDDFYGDALPDEPILLSGNDAEAVDPAIVANEQYGVVTLVSGDVGDTCANDCSEINYGTVYKANQGGLVFETRLHIDTAVTNASVCVGFTDVATIELPAKATGGGDGITAIADDAIAFCFDDAATTKEWFSFGIDGTTQATGNSMVGVGPTHSVYQVLRIEVDAGGEDARFYIDGTLVDTLTANVVLVTADLAPFIGVDSNTTASVTIDVDYIYVSAKR